MRGQELLELMPQGSVSVQYPYPTPQKMTKVVRVEEFDEDLSQNSPKPPVPAAWLPHACPGAPYSRVLCRGLGWRVGMPQREAPATEAAPEIRAGAEGGRKVRRCLQAYSPSS